MAAGDQAQPRQGDHGVAAPVGEPGVARDHGALAAAHQELVRSERQRRYQVAAIDRARRRANPRRARQALDQALAPPPLGVQQRVRVAAGGRLGRDHDADPAARRQLNPQDARREEVLVAVEAAIDLLLELEAQPPVGCRLEAAARHAQVDLGGGVPWPIGEDVIVRRRLAPEWTCRRPQLVVPAKGVERPQLELDRLSASAGGARRRAAFVAITPQLVQHDDRVLAGDRSHGLAQDGARRLHDAGEVVLEGREDAAFEPRQPLVAVRVHNPGNRADASSTARPPVRDGPARTVSSSLEKRTMRSTGGRVAATNRPW